MRKNRENGFRSLKSLIMKKQKVIGVVCGGDGTVGWVLTEINQCKLYTENITFAILPIGSGNDFSRTLNWGS